MQIVKNVFVDIHYEGDEGEKAMWVARQYERKGFSLESEDSECIQLVKTYILKKQ